MSGKLESFAGAKVRAGRLRSQLTAEELQQVKWFLGGALTLLSVATVFYLEVPAWTLMTLALVGVSAGLVQPRWAALVPRWVHRLAFPIIVAIFVGDLWLTGEVLPAMVRLDILLLLYRGITYRQKRDDLQVIVLGLFLVVVAGVLTVSLVFAVQILAFTACALGFLLVITLGDERGETERRVRRNAPDLPAWARDVSWRRLFSRVRAATDWRVVALGSALFAGLVGLSALLFLAIPRFQLENSLFLERFITKKARTGFSDTIRFGDVTDIAQDNGVAASVDVSDRSRVPVSPYWRMLVLDDYRDGTFRLSPRMRLDNFRREQGGMALRGALRRTAEAPVQWTFYLEAGVSRFLPLLGDFEVLRFREPQNFRFSPRLGVVALRDEPVSMTAYRVEGMESGARISDRGFAEQFAEEKENPRRAGALMLRVAVGEADQAELRRIVAEVEVGGRKMRGEGTPPTKASESEAEGFARRATAWLDQRHAYSLQPKIPAGAGDPLVRWMASREGGHCELFAGSLVLLARTAGIPARVVTGFRGGSWNGYSNNFTLRNSDAHAWCEIFDGASESWLRADPTPGGTSGAGEELAGDAAIARRTDRSWTARFDSLRVFWYRRIVNFDQQSQLETLKAVKTASENSGRRVREALERWVRGLKGWVAAPWSGGRAAIVLAMLTAALGLGWAAWNFRVWIFDFRFGGSRARVDAVRVEAGRWLQRLRRAEGGRQSGGDVGLALRENAERAAVVAALQRLRFGARETWGDAAGVFRRARRAVRRRRSVGRER